MAFFLLSPSDGLVSSTRSANALTLVIRKPTDPNTVSFTVTGDIRDEGPDSREVKAGGPVGRTQDTGRKLPVGGAYNVIINATQATDGKLVQRSDILEAMFLAAFTKGPARHFYSSNNAIHRPYPSDR